MRAMNLDMNEDWLQRGRAWLESVQHDDGGWGERCNTYDDPGFQRAGAEHRIANRVGGDGPVRV
jgi:squalene-hopene/tetraprenyl-beta-curcumene cyclase